MAMAQKEAGDRKSARQATREAAGAGGFGEGGFRAGAVILLALTSCILFVITLYAFLGEQQGRDRGDTRAPSSTGVTAIGLGGLNELLRRVDRRLEPKAGVKGRASPGAVVLVSDLNDEARLRQARYRFENARAILVILPKWRIPWFTFGRKFAEQVWLTPSSEPQNAAAEAMKAGLASATARPKILREPGAFAAPSRNPLGVAPSIDKAQLLVGGGLTPIVANADGAMLLAEIPTADAGLPPLFILSDPDPLLNHALDEGDNALFAVRLIELLGGEDAVVAFDDGPGAPRTPASFWFAMFEPPLIAITIAIIALFAGLGLIALARFGGRAPDRPGQAAGKEALLDAAASLLRQGDGDRFVIRRFLEETMRDVAAQLQAPSLPERTALIKWLAQLERARRARLSVTALDEAVAEITRSRAIRPERLTDLARDINAWREEMLRGHA